MTFDAAIGDGRDERLEDDNTVDATAILLLTATDDRMDERVGRCTG